MNGMATLLLGDFDHPPDEAEIQQVADDCHAVATLALGVDPHCTYDLVFERATLEHRLVALDYPGVAEALERWDLCTHPVAVIHYTTKAWLN
jgi:hypothetical protein